MSALATCLPALKSGIWVSVSNELINALTEVRFSGPKTDRRLRSPFIAYFLLLQRDQNGNQPLAFCERSQRLANHRAKRLEGIACLHRVARRGRSCEQIACFNCAKRSVHLAKNLAHQCHGLPVARGLSLVQHDACLVFAAAKNSVQQLTFLDKCSLIVLNGNLLFGMEDRPCWAGTGI